MRALMLGLAGVVFSLHFALAAPDEPATAVAALSRMEGWAALGLWRLAQGAEQVKFTWLLGSDDGEPGRARWDPGLGRFWEVTLPPRVPWAETPGRLAPEDVLVRATAFLERLPWSLPGYRVLLAVAADAHMGALDQGEVDLPFTRVEQRTGFSNGYGRVRIRLADGSIRSLVDRCLPVPAGGGLLDHATAERKAAELAAAALDKPLTEIHVLQCGGIWQNGAAGTAPHYLVTVALKAPARNGITRAYWADLDGRTGVVKAKAIMALPSDIVGILLDSPAKSLRDRLGRLNAVRDSWPWWPTDAGTVWFASNRCRIGGVCRSTSCVARVGIGHRRIDWEVAGWPPLARDVVVAELASSVLALAEPQVGLTILNLDTAERIVRADFRCARGELDTRNLGMVAVGLEADGSSDLFVASYQPARGTLGEFTALRCTEHAPRLPLLSADGRRVLFVRPKAEPHHHALDAADKPADQPPRVDGDILVAGAGRELPRQAVKAVSRDWQGVTRLSRVGDSERLLVSCAQGLVLLDLASGNRSAVPGQPFKDPDTKEPLVPVEGQVSPDGRRVAFGAKTKGDAQHESYQCLYVVDLDGGHLQRLTPRADPVIEPADLGPDKPNVLELNKRWWRERQAERLRGNP